MQPIDPGVLSEAKEAYVSALLRLLTVHQLPGVPRAAAGPPGPGPVRLRVEAAAA